MAKEKLLPEQTELWDDSHKYDRKISEQFLRVIDKSDSFYGMLLFDRETVDVEPLRNAGYSRFLNFEYFARGAAYARLIGKRVALYVPPDWDIIRLENELVSSFVKTMRPVKMDYYPVKEDKTAPEKETPTLCKIVKVNFKNAVKP